MIDKLTLFESFKLVNEKYFKYMTNLTFLVLGIISYPIVERTVDLIQHYVFSDFEYLRFLFVLITLDFFTGIAKSIKQGNYLTSTAMKRTLMKIVQYGCPIIVGSVIAHAKINNEVQIDFNWVYIYICTLMLLIESLSIFENLKILNPKIDIVNFIYNKLKEIVDKTTNLKKEDKSE